MAAFEVAMAAAPENWYIFNNSVAIVLPIARAMIQGELLFREGEYDKAFATLREGIAAEDALVYETAFISTAHESNAIDKACTVLVESLHEL